MKDIPENLPPGDGFHTLKLTRNAILLGEEAAALSDALETALDGQGYSVFARNKNATDGDDWEIALITPQAPDLAHMQQVINDIAGAGFSLTAEKHAHQNWLEQVHRDFPPLVLSGFYIYGSHSVNTAPANLIPLNIDAATAFGSGEHETTKGCLLLLEGLKKTAGFTPARGLDMGCGSGILAIAMKKLWPEIAVLAVDIDPESVRVTARHAQMNETPMMAEAGDGYDAPSVTKYGPHDLIAANILAGPLVSMAPALARHMAPGGYAILSGLLARQRQEVTSAHTALGLTLKAELVLGDWAALLFQKSK